MSELAAIFREKNRKIAMSRFTLVTLVTVKILIFLKIQDGGRLLSSISKNRDMSIML